VANVSETNETGNAKQSLEKKSAADMALEFFKELAIFICGLLLGFFWYMYYRQAPGAEVHIIIGLIVIVICLVRYIGLTRKS
jgi:hypothetical protein